MIRPIAAALVVLVPQSACCPSRTESADHRADSTPRSVLGAAGGSGDEIEIRRLEDNWCVALKTQDPALLDEILAPDYVEIASSGAIERRDAAIGGVKDPRNSTTACGNSGLKVRIYGDAAVATGVMDQAGTANGAPYRGKQIVFTDTYIKQSGRWKCVVGQSTLLRKGTSGS